MRQEAVAVHRGAGTARGRIPCEVCGPGSGQTAVVVGSPQLFPLRGRKHPYQALCFNVPEPEGFETAENDSKLPAKSPGLLEVSGAFSCDWYPRQFCQSLFLDDVFLTTYRGLQSPPFLIPCFAQT